LKSFFWETESPRWYECVVLYSEEALRHQVVSLHFRVLSSRVILDAKLEEELNSEDSRIVSECRDRLSQNLPVPRRVQFSNVKFIAESSFSELVMQMEVEQMLAEDDPLSSEEYLMSSDSEEEFFEEGNFYEAEVFGDRFIDEQVVQVAFPAKRKSSIKQHMLASILNGVESPLLAHDGSVECLSSFHKDRLGATTLETDPELGFWEMQFDSEDEGETSDLEVEDDLPLNKNCTKKCTIEGHKRASSAPSVCADFHIESSSSELERKAAFISTRGKEKEMWQTYRAEITHTWRVELKELQRQLFAYE